MRRKPIDDAEVLRKIVLYVIHEMKMGAFRVGDVLKTVPVQEGDVITEAHVDIYADKLIVSCPAVSLDLEHVHVPIHWRENDEGGSGPAEGSREEFERIKAWHDQLDQAYSAVEDAFEAGALTAEERERTVSALEAAYDALSLAPFRRALYR